MTRHRYTRKRASNLRRHKGGPEFGQAQSFRLEHTWPRPTDGAPQQRVQSSDSAPPFFFLSFSSNPWRAERTVAKHHTCARRSHSPPPCSCQSSTDRESQLPSMGVGVFHRARAKLVIPSGRERGRERDMPSCMRPSPDVGTRMARPHPSVHHPRSRRGRRQPRDPP